jgi:hypothetical protein
MAGPYDNPIPTGFLVPIDCSKIPAQSTPSDDFKEILAIDYSRKNIIMSEFEPWRWLG